MKELHTKEEDIIGKTKKDNVDDDNNDMDTSSHRADKLTKLSSYALLSSDKFSSLCKLVKTLSDHVT
ncbi:hypothetical protein CK203_003711 [Vitis vinifera]|uniref:Uncharacterized protein n=1 Tax=Vitis vinifera TaxID=29760 RepID=A0A438K8E3_VITVI|nr:hypothetical protein CK203_003711 [Vitis vinifera]